MSNEFFELYKRPEWQEKRLRIMERAGFRCELCSCKDKTLHVHHSHYVRGRKPWEYEDNELSCICEDCHESRHELLKHLKLLCGKMHPDAFAQLLGYASWLTYGSTAERISIPDGVEPACFLFGVTQGTGVSQEIALRHVESGGSYQGLNSLAEDYFHSGQLADSVREAMHRDLTTIRIQVLALKSFARSIDPKLWEAVSKSMGIKE
jgi:hypothetical protein